MRACPQQYPPDTCHLLSFKEPQLCVSIVVPSRPDPAAASAPPCAALPPLLQHLLLETSPLPLELSLVLDAGVDDACAAPAYKLLRDAGLTLHVCKGAACKGSPTARCGARLSLLIRDDVELEPGAFHGLMAAAALMPRSLLSPSVYATVGRPGQQQRVMVLGSETEFGLTQVHSLPTFFLLGHTAAFASLMSSTAAAASFPLLAPDVFAAPTSASLSAPDGCGVTLFLHRARASLVDLAPASSSDLLDDEEYTGMDVTEDPASVSKSKRRSPPPFPAPPSPGAGPLSRISLSLPPTQDVLFIDGYLPTPDKDSGSRRTSALISLLIQQGHRVSFQPIVSLEQVHLASGCEEARYRALMQDLGARLLHPGFPNSWPRDTYDTIIVARRSTMGQVADFLRSESRGAGIMYDTVDLHFLREARLAMSSAVSRTSNLTLSLGVGAMDAWLEDPANAEAAVAVTSARETELGHMRLSHVTIVVSDYEAAVIKRHQPDAQVAIISNIIGEPLAFDIARSPPCRERAGLLFVGQFGHTPNAQALDVLLRVILPDMAVRPRWAAPGAMPPVHIVGSGHLAPGLRRRLSRLPYVHIHTDLSDLELHFLYMEARVAIAPLVSGAGVKGKINQAMTLGVPVVATTIAVEAMHVVHGVDAMVAHNLAEFSQHLETVYFDLALCDALAKAAHASVYRHFSLEHAGGQVAKALQQLGRVKQQQHGGGNAGDGRPQLEGGSKGGGGSKSGGSSRGLTGK